MANIFASILGKNAEEDYTGLEKAIKRMRGKFKEMYGNRHIVGAELFRVTADSVIITQNGKETKQLPPVNKMYKDDFAYVMETMTAANKLVKTEQGYIRLEDGELCIYNEEPEALKTKEFVAPAEAPVEAPEEVAEEASDENVVDAAIRESVGVQETLDRLDAEKSANDAAMSSDERHDAQMSSFKEPFNNDAHAEAAAPEEFVAEEPKTEEPAEESPAVEVEPVAGPEVKTPEEKLTEIAQAQTDGVAEETHIYDEPEQPAAPLDAFGFLDKYHEFIASLRIETWTVSLRNRIINQLVSFFEAMGPLSGFDSGIRGFAVENLPMIVGNYQEYLMKLGKELRTRASAANSEYATKVANRMAEELDFTYLNTK